MDLNIMIPHSENDSVVFQADLLFVLYLVEERGWHTPPPEACSQNLSWWVQRIQNFRELFKYSFWRAVNWWVSGLRVAWRRATQAWKQWFCKRIQWYKLCFCDFFFFFGYMFHLTSYFSSVFIKASVRFLDKAVVILGVARARIHIQGELIRRW